VNVTPLAVLRKVTAEEALFRMIGVEIVVELLPELKRPEFVPVPPIVIEVPPEIVLTTGAEKEMLLADCAPETVIVPVVPPVTKRSSAEVGEATKVPPGPPALEVFQKALVVPFHVPVMVLNPAVLPLTSQ